MGLFAARGERSASILRLLTLTMHRTKVLAVEMDGKEGVKSERVTNFLTVPGALEKVIGLLVLN